MTSIKYGNFLADPFDFDAAFFNISPREAKSMDPQQRLLLRGALEALDDAGYAPNTTDTFQANSMGVYVGVATCDYVDNLRDNIDVYYSPGELLLTNIYVFMRDSLLNLVLVCRYLASFP